MKAHLMRFTQSVFAIVVFIPYVGYAMDEVPRVPLALNVGVAAKASSRHCGKLEDRYCIDLHWPFIAVFDGHNGVAAAETAKLELVRNIHDICHKNNGQDYSDENIRESFRRTNTKILSCKDDSGSTASLVFFSRDARSDDVKLHVAHIGDSGVAVVYEDGISLLTTPHRISNNEELDRIKNFVPSLKRKLEEDRTSPLPRPKKKFCCTKLDFADANLLDDIFPEQIKVNVENHPLDTKSVFESCADIRPFAPLLPSRMVPIKEIKKKKEFDWASTGLSVTRCFGHKHLRNKGLSDEPQIREIPLRKMPIAILLYTDGVGDHLSPKDAHDIVKKGIAQKKSLNDVAQDLLIKAARCDKKNGNRKNHNVDDLLLGIQDDMTVVLIKFEDRT